MLFYLPYSMVSLFEAYSKLEVNPVLMRACYILVMVSPVWNGFMFGLKNKV